MLPDLALCHILQSIFILKNVCFHFTPNQPPPPPPAAEVQLRFHCQGQLCCRQLPAIGPTCGRSCRKLSPSDHFPRLAFLFASPPDFAKYYPKKKSPFEDLLKMCRLTPLNNNQMYTVSANFSTTPLKFLPHAEKSSFPTQTNWKAFTCG